MINKNEKVPAKVTKVKWGKKRLYAELVRSQEVVTTQAESPGMRTLLDKAILFSIHPMGSNINSDLKCQKNN